MLNTLPWPANQVSVHPPLSQIRIGALELTIRSGTGPVIGLIMPYPCARPWRSGQVGGLGPGSAGPRSGLDLRPRRSDHRIKDHLAIRPESRTCSLSRCVTYDVAGTADMPIPV